MQKWLLRSTDSSSGHSGIVRQNLHLKPPSTELVNNIVEGIAHDDVAFFSLLHCVDIHAKGSNLSYLCSCGYNQPYSSRLWFFRPKFLDFVAKPGQDAQLLWRGTNDQVSALPQDDGRADVTERGFV